MKLLLSSLVLLTVVLSYLAFRQKETPSVADQPAQKMAPKVAQALPVASSPTAPAPITPAPAVAHAKSANRPRNDLSNLPPEISQGELERRAAKVEQEANHELARLVKLLDLTEEQQDQVFAVLAENTADYHPSMNLTTSDLRPLPLPAASPTFDNGNQANGALIEAGRNQPDTRTNFLTDLGGQNPTRVGEPTPQPTPTVPSPTAKVTPTPSVAGGPTVSDAPTLSPTTARTPIEDLLAPYLPGPQQDLLREEEADRIAWWTELTTNLAAGLTAPAIDGGSTPPATISTSYNDDL